MANTTAAAATAKPKRTKKNSQGREICGRLCHRPTAMIALAGCAIMLFLAIFADLLVPYEMAIKQVASEKLVPPFSPGHLLGTDNFGRDILARIIHGARTALEIGLLATAASIVVSTILACVAAMLGGKVDNLIMRIVDILSCIPGMVTALAICASLGNGIPQLVTALTISGIPMHTKMIRSMALSVSKIIINGTAQVSINIMQGATLGFIGLGVKAPTPEWGTMLSDGLSFMLRNQYMVLIPGIVLCLAALCINTFGDCLRDAFDPQLKGKS